MGLVDEPHVVGHPVDPLPVDGGGPSACLSNTRWIIAERLVGDFSDLRFFRNVICLYVPSVDLLVADDADLDGRDGGGGAGGHVAVAEFALNGMTTIFHCSGMDGVGEWDWLVGGVAPPEGGGWRTTK